MNDIKNIYVSPAMVILNMSFQHCLCGSFGTEGQKGVASGFDADSD